MLLLGQDLSLKSAADIVVILYFPELFFNVVQLSNIRIEPKYSLLLKIVVWTTLSESYIGLILHFISVLLYFLISDECLVSVT